MDENLSYEENCDILAKSAGRALGSIISKYKSFKNMGYKTYTKLFESCVGPNILTLFSLEKQDAF